MVNHLFHLCSYILENCRFLSVWIFLVARCGGFLIFSYHNYLTVYLVLVCLSEPFIQLFIKCFRFLKCFCWVWLVCHICLLSLLWFYLFGTQILLHIRIWKEFLCFLWIWFSFKPLLLLERALLLGLYCFVFHQFYRGLLGVVARESRFQIYTLLEGQFVFP